MFLAIVSKLWVPRDPKSDKKTVFHVISALNWPIKAPRWHTDGPKLAERTPQGSSSKTQQSRAARAEQESRAAKPSRAAE